MSCTKLLNSRDTIRATITNSIDETPTVDLMGDAEEGRLQPIKYKIFKC